MPSDTKNVKLGVCKITFDSIDLGYTMGGVEVEVTTETHKVMVDQFGKTPVNEYVMGREVKVKAPLAETTLENLVQLMPGATLTAEVVGPPLVPAFVEVTTGVGTNLLDIAKELRLHPISLEDTDVSEDFVVLKAATAGQLSFAYKLEDERVFNAEFNGYPDATTGKLFTIGK